ncbi:HNH endonuclease [Comamonas sp. MYb69]|uniref:HNH endonuclease n=1 Tax=Comamonas sp. MYb69 TaxID=1848650 RepID=UPI00309CCC79
MTQEVMKQVLYYDKVSGCMYWRHAAKGRKAWAKAGCSRGDGYTVVSISGRFFYAHRLAWLYIYGNMPSGIVDHIDGNPSNNSIGNLRLVDKRGNAENMQRATRASKTGYLGVYLRSDTRRFATQIKADGKRHSLGCYASAEEAYAAYLKAKRELHPRGRL